LNEVKGQRVRKILSEDLRSFDNLDEYDDFKDYTTSDPVFSDDMIKVFTEKTEERMTVLHEIMLDIQADRATYLADFTKKDDFISLVSSRITIENLLDEDQRGDS
jgi:hypothetical protein